MTFNYSNLWKVLASVVLGQQLLLIWFWIIWRHYIRAWIFWTSLISLIVYQEYWGTCWRSLIKSNLIVWNMMMVCITQLAANIVENKKNFPQFCMNFLLVRSFSFSLPFCARAKISQNSNSSLNAIPSLLAREQGDFCRKGPNFQGLKLLGGFDSLELKPVIYLFPFQKALVCAKKKDILLFSCSQFSSQKVQYHSYLLKDELGIYLLSNIKNFFCRFYDI